MNRRQTPELLFTQAAENDWSEPILPGAAIRKNVWSSIGGQKSGKPKLSFAKSLLRRIFL
jgi:hypothetical protein